MCLVHSAWIGTVLLLLWGSIDVVCVGVVEIDLVFVSGIKIGIGLF